MSEGEVLDLLIVGGGVNGAGIAADAAGRGMSVMLIDQDDLASSTSTISGRMFLGGLRYLERFDLALVYQSLCERGILLRRAPHLVEARDFIQVHHPERCSLRRGRMLLWLYDLLGGRHLGRSRLLDLRDHPLGRPVRDRFTHGFHYRDCTGNDSRLALANARLARRLGARVMPRTRLLRAWRRERHWEVRLEDTNTYEARTVRARAMVNTSGPWVNELLEHQLGIQCRCRSRLVKVSHLVTRPLYEGDQVYVLTAPNGHRICINPLPEGYHLIGSSENDFSGEPRPVEPSAGEITWLLDIVNEHLDCQLGEGDIVEAYSGLRPVYDDPARPSRTATRNYLLDLDCPDCHSPVLNVFGGRLTNYRRMAEQALEILRPWLPAKSGRWTRHAPLPGGALPEHGMDGLREQIRERYPWLDAQVGERLARTYGAEIWEVINGAHSIDDLGGNVYDGVSSQELEYLVREEWATCAEDVLNRRTHTGIGLPADQRERLESWFSSHAAEYRPQ